MAKLYQICCPKCNNYQNFYRYGKDKNGNQKYLCRVCGHQFAPDTHTAGNPGRPRVCPYPTCPVCGKRFFEENSFLLRYYHITSLLAAYIVSNLSDVRSFTSVAREVNLSVSTIIRIFDCIDHR